jgi:hypothetical protein
MCCQITAELEVELAQLQERNRALEAKVARPLLVHAVFRV